MRVLLALVLMSGFATTGFPEITEESTGETFAESLKVGEKDLACTGVTYRSKFGMRIYAIAHYGHPAAAPAGTPEEKLAAWAKAKADKAIAITFVYSVDEYNMRSAAEEALDKAGYVKPDRAKFLNEFSRDYPEGTKVQLHATAEGVLRIIMGDKVLGEYKDQELIDAMWVSWLGEDSVVKKREDLVAREIKKAE